MTNMFWETRANHQPVFMVHLITLDPAHFHAALLLKKNHPKIDSVVHVYAPDGPDLRAHLQLIDQYNQQLTPANWKTVVYTGKDYAERMAADQKGNLVILSGNNAYKTRNITLSVNAGLNVLADKPMAISEGDFQSLLRAFNIARDKKVLLYDIMTERYEICHQLQRALAADQQIFGNAEKGSRENPAVIMESKHHYFKKVSGKAIQRPAWFFDPRQQGDPLADVGTHLADLIFWTCFPDKAIDYKSDLTEINTRFHPLKLSREQFHTLTDSDNYPEFLQPYIQSDNTLELPANGELNFVVKGVHARVSVNWAFESPHGADTHLALLRGTHSDLVIRQQAEGNFIPELYILAHPPSNQQQVSTALQQFIQQQQQKFPGLDVKEVNEGWKIVIPEKLRNSHEDRFSLVLDRYIQYLEKKELPDWEIPNMIAKYYLTTSAKGCG